MEALVGDEELAAKVLDAPERRGLPKVRMSEYSPEMERLTDLFDRIGELITVVAASAGVKKPPRPRPAPRPVTASQRLSERRRQAKHRSVVARMLPHKAQDS